MKDSADRSVPAYERLASRATAIRDALMRAELASWAPEAGKTLRRFSPNETGYFLGVTDSHLRRLHAEGRVREPEQRAGGRRYYSEQEIQEIREYLERHSKVRGTYKRGRVEGDSLQVVAVTNFPGGSGKTSTTAHLATAMGLRGYKVLVVDLDPQGSLTALFGLAAAVYSQTIPTIYDALRYENPVHLESCIRKTHLSTVDFVPASLQLGEYEHETPLALRSQGADGAVPFDLRLKLQIDAIESQYDLVLIDCPPQLGFLTLTALCAATGILITVIPAMLDIASMEQFLTMASALLESIAARGEPLRWQFEKFLLTRFEPNDAPSQQMAAFLRSRLGEDVLLHPFVKSTAVSDASMTRQTIYEVSRSDMHRQTYDRGFDAVELVAQSFENEIRRTWGREPLEILNGA
jgi:chromosome partitioning protein